MGVRGRSTRDGVSGSRECCDGHDRGGRSGNHLPVMTFEVSRHDRPEERGRRGFYPGDHLTDASNLRLFHLRARSRHIEGGLDVMSEVANALLYI